MTTQEAEFLGGGSRKSRISVKVYLFVTSFIQLTHSNNIKAYRYEYMGAWPI